MALSDFAVFSEYAYSAMTEVLDQKVTGVAEASRGAITIANKAHTGDYSEKAFFAKISGLVRRRDPYGTGAVTAKDLTHLTDTMVKVAAGTPPVNIDPGMFKWIQLDPKVAGATIGAQLAGDTLADMLNTSFGATYAALSNEADLVNTETGEEVTPAKMNNTTRLFGDASDELRVWVAHSKILHDLYGNNLANVERLFTWNSINIIADAFGRIIIPTDTNSLVEVDGVGAGIDKYASLALVSGAISIDRNVDFTDNIETSNGDENILRTYQAEWSFNLGVKGFAWDKTNGGAAPNDAALIVATNWDLYSTSLKDTAGVVLETR